MRKQKKRRMVADEKELAFYYPGPVWHSGDWIKNLILFFDGIALFVPDYIKDEPDIVDPAIAAGLRNEGLLHILEPEKIVDKAATRKLADAMSEVIASGMLDQLAKTKTDFHELSFSRLGGYGDLNLATQIFESLKKRDWHETAMTENRFPCIQWFARSYSCCWHRFFGRTVQ